LFSTFLLLWVLVLLPLFYEFAMSSFIHGFLIFSHLLPNNFLLHL
jgi:hypothetical protein